MPTSVYADLEQNEAVAAKIFPALPHRIIRRLAREWNWVGDDTTVVSTEWYKCRDGIAVAVDGNTLRDVRKQLVAQTFSAVGEISRTDFLCGPFGNANLETARVEDLANAEASFYLREPQDGLMETAWQDGCANLGHIAGRDSLGARSEQRGLLDSSNGDRRLLIQYKLFEPRSSVRAHNIPQLLNANLDSYPVPEKHRAGLKGPLLHLDTTHVVNTAPIYTNKATIILPSNWEILLPGALVECHFGLEHRFEDGVSVFRAELRELIVLREGRNEIIQYPRRDRGDAIEWGPAVMGSIADEDVEEEDIEVSDVAQDY